MDGENFSLLNFNDLKKMKDACLLAGRLLKYLESMIVPGVSTLDINVEAEAFTLSYKASSGPLGYYGYPRSICTSINEVVCHGIPSKSVILRDGDIINIDVSPMFNGFFGDTSRTFLVGTNVSKENKKLVKVTEECMWKGIKETAKIEIQKAESILKFSINKTKQRLQQEIPNIAETICDKFLNPNTPHIKTSSQKKKL